MAANDILLIETMNVLGRTIKIFNVNGPASYAQATGQVLKPNDLQMKTISGALVVGQMITDSSGADFAVAEAWVNGKTGSNQGAGSGGTGTAVNVEVHFNTLGSTEVANATDLSAKSYRLMVIGT